MIVISLQCSTALTEASQALPKENKSLALNPPLRFPINFQEIDVRQMRTAMITTAQQSLVLLNALLDKTVMGLSSPAQLDHIFFIQNVWL